MSHSHLLHVVYCLYFVPNRIRVFVTQEISFYTTLLASSNYNDGVYGVAHPLKYYFKVFIHLFPVYLGACSFGVMLGRDMFIKSSE